MIPNSDIEGQAKIIVEAEETKSAVMECSCMWGDSLLASRYWTLDPKFSPLRDFRLAKYSFLFQALSAHGGVMPTVGS